MTNNEKRNFIPGSEWVYFKIYAGYKTIDKIISEELSLIVKDVKNKQLIDKWFFIRYSDPDFHLRIRFHTVSLENVGQIINIVYKRLNILSKDRLIWKIQLDTYCRELERYGKDLINVSESIFHKDSECIMPIIRGINKNSNENLRWMAALKMIDSFLTDFSFDLNQKLDFIEKLSTAYKREFGFNEYNSKQFNHKYRNNKNIVEDVLGNTIHEVEFQNFYKYINRRTLATKDERKYIINELNKMKGKENRILASYIHMMTNRLFTAKSRIHEMVIYDFLKRYYTSQIARIKYSYQ